jgi:2-hydroxychromene-2-carboxylate isomerase
MTHVVDVFWSFRSPYSYLVTPDLLRLREDFQVDIHLRPVLPIAVRTKETLFSGDRRRVNYILLDSRRRAEFLNMTIRRPAPDPIVQDFSTFEVSEPIRKGIESPESDVIRCPCGRFAGAGNGVDGGASTNGGSARAALPV